MLSSPLGFALKSLKCLHCKTNLAVTYLPSNLKILVLHTQLDFLVQFPFGCKIKFGQNDLKQCTCIYLEAQGYNSKFLLVPNKIP